MKNYKIVFWEITSKINVGYWSLATASSCLICTSIISISGFLLCQSKRGTVLGWRCLSCISITILKLWANLVYVYLWQDVLHHICNSHSRERWRLMQVHSVILGDTSRLIFTHNSFACQVNLIASNDHGCVLILHLVNTLHPGRNRFVGLLVC